MVFDTVANAAPALVHGIMNITASHHKVAKAIKIQH